MGMSDRHAVEAAKLLHHGHIRADNITTDGVQTMATVITETDNAAQRCGIREGETLAEFIRRLYDETLADREDR